MHLVLSRLTQWLGDLRIDQSPQLNPEQLACWITSSHPSITDELGKTQRPVTYLVHQLQLSLVIEYNLVGFKLPYNTDADTDADAVQCSLDWS